MVNFFQKQGYTNSTLLREALHHFYAHKTENPDYHNSIETPNTDTFYCLEKKIDDMAEKLNSLYNCYDGLFEIFKLQETNSDFTKKHDAQESTAQRKELKKNLLSFRM